MSGRKKRERRDADRAARGLRPRKSIADRRLATENNERRVSNIERLTRDEAVFSRHGLILPPGAGDRLVLAVRK